VLGGDGIQPIEDFLGQDGDDELLGAFGAAVSARTGLGAIATAAETWK